MNIWDSLMRDPRERFQFKPSPLVKPAPYSPAPQGLDIQPQPAQQMMPLPPVPAMQEQGSDPLSQLSGMGSSRLMSMFLKPKAAGAKDALAAWKAGGSL